MRIQSSFNIDNGLIPGSEEIILEMDRLASEDKKKSMSTVASGGFSRTW